MKREQLILQGMSDPQLEHAQRLLKREINRRLMPPKKASAKSGTYARVTPPATQGRRKTA